MDALFFTWCAVWLLIMIRNEIVYRIRRRACEAIFNGEDWHAHLARLRSPTYIAMLFDLTRWSFRSFYPDLVAREARRTA